MTWLGLGSRITIIRVRIFRGSKYYVTVPVKPEVFFYRLHKWNKMLVTMTILLWALPYILSTIYIVCEGVKSGQTLVCPGGLGLITNRGPQTQTNYTYRTSPPPTVPPFFQASEEDSASPCPGVSSRFYFGLSWEAPHTCRSIASPSWPGRLDGSSGKNDTSIIIRAMEWACHLLTIVSLPEP